MSRHPHRFVALVLLLVAACSSPADPPAATGLDLAGATTTTTTSPPPTTTTAPPPPPTTTTTAKPRPEPTVRAASAAMTFDGSDRWDALAACESTGDTDGVAPHRINNNPDGYHLTAFQFSPDTARKVGAYRGMPYAESKAAAQRWAAEPTVDASSRSGWPTCWPMVMGDTPT